MVYYFTSTAVQPPASIYVGKDKFENEELIAHGWPEDIWFHVDGLSSAHIYLRLPLPAPGTPQTSEQPWHASVPPAVLTDCAHLTAANSIAGSKQPHVTVVYTPWANLRKDGSMAVGQVGFKDSKMVRRVGVGRVEGKGVVKSLEKTRREAWPDLKAEREGRDREVGRGERRIREGVKKEEQKLAEEHARLKWQKEHMYDDLHTDDNLQTSSNQDREADFLDDFIR
ncbi:hypothetical protein B0A50_06044 [Salinomyces thailandicus]|uniref:NFACT RNA-binding domain-containing protein n=1 Tax=Salinomyces thailandicus TaxID=706561 RepID=A0A4U0TSN1_9PEZI|nr:hypothetical protein B0A50_06044 [Salinomyces thailandica]